MNNKVYHEVDRSIRTAERIAHGRHAVAHLKWSARSVPIPPLVSSFLRLSLKPAQARPSVNCPRGSIFSSGFTRTRHWDTFHPRSSLQADQPRRTYSIFEGQDQSASRYRRGLLPYVATVSHIGVGGFNRFERPASSRRADLETSLGEVDRQNMDVGHGLLLRTRLGSARRHLTMPAGGGIHPSVQISSRSLELKLSQ